MGQWLLSFSLRWPRLALLIFVGITLLAGGGVSKLRIDTSLTTLTRVDDPTEEEYERIVAEFGSDNIVVIYVRDPTLFTPEKLSALQELSYRLEELLFVESVDSLFTLTNVRDRDGAVETSLFIEEGVHSVEAARRSRDDALLNPIVRRQYISDDGQAMALHVNLAPEYRDSTVASGIFETLDALLRPYEESFQELFQLGRPRIRTLFNQYIHEDAWRLALVAGAVATIVSYVFLRTLFAPLCIILTSAVSLLWTYGLLGYLGIPINLLMVMLPALVVVIGSTEDMHLLAMYLSGVSKGLDRQVATKRTARTIGAAVCLTGVTTTLGFGSNAFIDIGLVRQFGIAAGIAMAANLCVTLLAVPWLLVRWGPHHEKKRGTALQSRIRSVGVSCATFGASAPRVLWCVVAVVAVASVAAAARVNVNTDPLDFFSRRHALVRDVEKLKEDLAGLRRFYLVVELAEGSFKDPDNLQTLAQVGQFLRDRRCYDKIISVADILALVNREMHSGNDDFRQVPDTRDLVEQYLLFFRHRDLERLVSEDFKRANIVVRHGIKGSEELSQQLEQLRSALPALLSDEMTFTLAGLDFRINETSNHLISMQFQSIALLLLVLLAIMAWRFRSLAVGMKVLIPNAIPVAILFGIMGVSGVPLNLATLLVAVLTIGVAIDDTIHLFIQHEAYLRGGMPNERAVETAIRHEALPVVTTSAALAAGFLVLCTAHFRIVSQFGALAAVAMVLALLVDLLVTPQLLRSR